MDGSLIEKGRRVRDAIDDAHLTAQHIEELRQIVNAGVSEIRTYSGHLGDSVPGEVCSPCGPIESCSRRLKRALLWRSGTGSRFRALIGSAVMLSCPTIWGS